MIGRNSWKTGTCIPGSLLGKFGYLKKHQRRLECLSLVTDPTCDDCGTPRGERVDISCFKQLKVLCWRALRKKTDVKELRRCLRKLMNLVELTVDLLDTSAAGCWHYQHMKSEGDALAVMSGFLPELNFRSLDTTLPTLTKLTLRGVPVGITHGDEKLQFRSLWSLKLHDCPGTAQLLNAIAISTATIPLKVLEILQNHSPTVKFDPQSPSLYLKDFLLCFTGLERVYLVLCAESHWASINEGILNHISSLKHLVIHHRVSQSDGESRYHRTSHDQNIPHDVDILHLLNKLELESLGIGNTIESLVSFLYRVLFYINSLI